jgi:hypothetical protein
MQYTRHKCKKKQRRFKSSSSGLIVLQVEPHYTLLGDIKNLFRARELLHFNLNDVIIRTGAAACSTTNYGEKDLELKLLFCSPSHNH